MCDSGCKMTPYARRERFLYAGYTFEQEREFKEVRSELQGEMDKRSDNDAEK